MTSPDSRAFRALQQLDGQFSLLMDEQFEIVWHSTSLERVLGWNDVSGRSAIDFVHPDDLELVLDNMVRTKEAGARSAAGETYAPESADVRLLHASGEYRTFAGITYDFLDDPDVRGVMCTCAAIKDRSDLPRAIELLGTGADIELVIPVLARLADCSMGGDTRAAIAWKQGDRIRVAASPDVPLPDPRLADGARLVFDLHLTAPLMITDLDDRRLNGLGNHARDAGMRAVYLVPIESPDAAEIIGGMVVWGRTITEFHIGEQTPVHVALRLAALAIADNRIKRDLRWAASHDPLTGLVNRAEFERRLQQMAHADLVLLYIDLDDFKPINDRYGHPAGDRVLVEVARRIEDSIGADDLAGRLGGDEFAVACPGAEALERGSDVADRLVRAIREPMLHGELALSVGASVGVALGVHPLIPSVLVQQADRALYAAKHAGKNTVCLAS
ncbi:MAG: diguanylate cyclase [Ilumatobacteraceae bacterium]